MKCIQLPFMDSKCLDPKSERTRSHHDYEFFFMRCLSRSTLMLKPGFSPQYLIVISADGTALCNMLPTSLNSILNSNPPTSDFPLHKPSTVSKPLCSFLFLFRFPVYKIRLWNSRLPVSINRAQRYSQKSHHPDRWTLRKVPWSNPSEPPLCNASFHFVVHVLSHLILHY